MERFPRLRSREEHRANQPLLFAAVGVALVMVALAVFPIIMNSRSGTPLASESPGALASGSTNPIESALPSDTGSLGPSFISYIVLKTDVAGLSGIAAKFNVALSVLEAANPQIANFNVIWPGMVVYIPPPGWQPPQSSPSPSVSPSAT